MNIFWILNSSPQLVESSQFLIFAAPVAALAFCFFLILKIVGKPEGDDKMKSIARKINEGAMAFLKTEYTRLALFVFVLFMAIFYFIDKNHWIPEDISSITEQGKIPGGSALCFLFGSICSAGAGWVGMQIATRANVRTTEGARKSLSEGLSVAFSSGVVMGMVVVGLGLLGIASLYKMMQSVDALFGFSLGASSIALFARVGGGIYTKAADVGADLVGKIEAGIPEDDPRNPAVIADNVGDNVGDVAGMGADLFESYVGSIIATMALGIAIDSSNSALVTLPILLSAIGIVASIVGSFFVSTNDEKKIGQALFRGLWVASLLSIAGSWFALEKLGLPPSLFGSILSGIVVGVLIGKVTEWYTALDTPSVKEIARQAETGPATVVIQGLAVGMESVVIPVLLICGAIWSSFYFAGGLEATPQASLYGLYGIAIAAVGMLSTLGISLGIDAYGPVADNAGGIAEMSGLPKEVRERTDSLDAVGNTTAAIGKGFAIGSAALTALALFSTFTTEGKLQSIDLTRYDVTIGLFLGSALVFLFSSLSMRAVGRAAGQMVEEVRRQFKTIPGLMEGTAEPDSKRCVEISTAAALREMIIPGVLAVASPILCGYFLGKQALGGLLAGSLVSGVMMAIFMSNAGGAWDNAKKQIEKREPTHPHAKGSNAHKAAVVGDTIGDPFKDTSGPSLNILIKLMCIVSLVFLPLFPL